MSQQPEIDRIDVCMPTWNSGAVLTKTLDRLAESEAAAPIRIERLIVIDNRSTDETVEIARSQAGEHGWELVVHSTELPLNRAREAAIDRVQTEWFLFLDDDVRLTGQYLTTLADAVAPLVGGIQGRKGSSGDNAKWVRWRSHRAGTHATLIRTAAVRSLTFPPDLVVLEDEYLRQHVEAAEYLWVFNHQARFTHVNQQRHPASWTEGILGGKYGLGTFCLQARAVPAAVLDGRLPVGEAVRATGWIVGWIRRVAD